MGSTIPLLNVLVVNDQLDMCKMWQRFIDMTPGLACHRYATDGEMALDMIRKEQPHVVIMDVLMPVMRGDDAMAIIHEQFPDVAVVMYSADVTLEESLRAAGAADFIGLPVSPTTLTTTIRRAWHNKHTS